MMICFLDFIVLINKIRSVKYIISISQLNYF